MNVLLRQHVGPDGSVQEVAALQSRAFWWFYIASLGLDDDDVRSRAAE